MHWNRHCVHVHLNRRNSVHLYWNRISILGWIWLFIYVENIKWPFLRSFGFWSKLFNHYFGSSKSKILALVYFFTVGFWGFGSSFKSNWSKIDLVYFFCLGSSWTIKLEANYVFRKGSGFLFFCKSLNLLNVIKRSSFKAIAYYIVFSSPPYPIILFKLFYIYFRLVIISINKLLFFTCYAGLH